MEWLIILNMPNSKHKRKLTDEQSVILDMWYQFSYELLKNNKEQKKYIRRWSGCLSALESCQSYLKEHKIINSWGNKRPEIEW